MKLHPTSDQQVFDAMKQYDAGVRPDYMGTSIRWHIAHPSKEASYPLKAIWALSVERDCRKFSSGKFIRDKLRSLGFICFEQKKSLDKKLQQDIERSRNDTSEARQERLRSAPRKPAKTMQAVVRFQRNPDVIAERLHMAQGKCENCKKPAPFHRKTDSTPFLEVHHVIPLADDGDDTVENTRALCPNCHRKAHFG